jgi:hypothetical protein
LSVCVRFCLHRLERVTAASSYVGSSTSFKAAHKSIEALKDGQLPQQLSEIRSSTTLQAVATGLGGEFAIVYGEFLKARLA